MVRKSVMLVDADPHSQEILEISLRSAGFNIATCADIETALANVNAARPDIVLAETIFPESDGFELLEALRADPHLASIPMILLSSDPSLETQIRGLRLGACDFLTKPTYTHEVITRIRLALQRHQRDSVVGEPCSTPPDAFFAGSFAEMGVFDLLRTIETSRKTGILSLRAACKPAGRIAFSRGQIWDAELGTIRGERALYRMLSWTDGEFEFEFGSIGCARKITTPTSVLFMDGLRRVDRWNRVREQLPALETILEIDVSELVRRLGEIPDPINAILREIDGKRSILRVLDRVNDDLEGLSILAKLYFEGIVQCRAETGRQADRNGQDSEMLVVERAAPSLSPRGAVASASQPANIPAPSSLSPVENG